MQACVFSKIEEINYLNVVISVLLLIICGWICQQGLFTGWHGNFVAETYATQRFNTREKSCFVHAWAFVYAFLFGVGDELGLI